MKLKTQLISFLALFGLACYAQAADYTHSTPAVQGYDVVSYHTGKRPVRGNGNFVAVHDGATYQFSSSDNQKAFVTNPEKYVPAVRGLTALSLITLSASVSAGRTEHPEVEASTEHSQLVIFRPKNPGKTSHLNYRVAVDGKRLGRFKAGTSHLVKLEPGIHSLKASDRGSVPVQFTVDGEQTVILKGEVNRDLSLDWSQVSAEQAVQSAPFLADLLPENVDQKYGRLVFSPKQRRPW